MSTRLSHAMLFVTDLGRMAEFYGAVFELRREDSSDDGFLFLRGGAGGDLALHRLPPEVLGELASPPRWREDCAIKLCFTVERFDDVRQLLIDRGGQAKAPWSWEGTQFCECCDPEGNVIQLVRARS